MSAQVLLTAQTVFRVESICEDGGVEPEVGEKLLVAAISGLMQFWTSVFELSWSRKVAQPDEIPEGMRDDCC